MLSGKTPTDNQRKLNNYQWQFFNRQHRLCDTTDANELFPPPHLALEIGTHDRIFSESPFQPDPNVLNSQVLFEPEILIEMKDAVANISRTK